jgi:hypothetical protein
MEYRETERQRDKDVTTRTCAANKNATLYFKKVLIVTPLATTNEATVC